MTAELAPQAVPMFALSGRAELRSYIPCWQDRGICTFTSDAKRETRVFQREPSSPDSSAFYELAATQRAAEGYMTKSALMAH